MPAHYSTDQTKRPIKLQKLSSRSIFFPVTYFQGISFIRR